MPIIEFQESISGLLHDILEIRALIDDHSDGDSEDGGVKKRHQNQLKRFQVAVFNSVASGMLLRHVAPFAALQPLAVHLGALAGANLEEARSVVLSALT